HLKKGLMAGELASDVFLLLGKYKIIESKLAENLAKAVGFRNILIHEYAKIDNQLVYRYYQDDLEDLRRFGKEISKKFL
ncbi:hypothetical protein COY29_05715, partial [Candidatus Woesebacteria bacterium CG_4_10_14_0_2_um_filter_39_14]